MSKRAEGKFLSIIAADGFAETELTPPRDAIEFAGGQTCLITADGGDVQGNRHREHGVTLVADLAMSQAQVEDYDALLILGGLFSPDTLRTNDDALEFVEAFFRQKKPVFAICETGQVLISADLI